MQSFLQETDSLLACSIPENSTMQDFTLLFCPLAKAEVTSVACCLFFAIQGQSQNSVPKHDPGAVLH